MTLEVDITHRQGDFTLQAALTAGPGVTAVFGRSGAGKTTLINAVAGLIRPDAGHIRLGGTALFDGQTHLPPHKRRMGYVFQDARLFPHMTVARNLRYSARVTRTALPAGSYDSVVTLLGLEALLSRHPHHLSGGERQRVALGRALLSDPHVLLMDEPLAALDAARKDVILPYLERLKLERPDLPILYVSHALDEIARLADHLVILSGGRIAQAGDVYDVLSDPEALPLLGVRQAGALVMAKVAAHGSDGLSQLTLAAGSLTLPGVRAPVGAQVRLRILAQDVILARALPQGLSTQNVLTATVRSIRTGDGPGAAVALQAGTDRLLARVPADAVARLDLTPGTSVHAIINATSIAPVAIGR